MNQELLPRLRKELARALEARFQAVGADASESAYEVGWAGIADQVMSRSLRGLLDLGQRLVKREDLLAL